MNTLNTPLLRQSLRDWLGSDPAPGGPRWLQLVWTFLFCMAIALLFTVSGILMTSHGGMGWHSLSVWTRWYGVNLVISLFVGYTIHALFALGTALMGPERIRALAGLKRVAYFAGIPMLGVALGWPLGVTVAGFESIFQPLLKHPRIITLSVLLSLGITSVLYLFFEMSARRLQAEKRAVEARLRLLQGQIEPHFLFNTLANVVSLIDHDAPRAKQMLESFTEYLRASFTSLRREQATLGGELDLVQHYLALLQTRMEERLTFSMDSDADVREAVIPPLLLQPLVENAIHHGLEPKVEGGHIRITAKRDGDMLVIDVADDGMGLGASTRRSGAGVALANVRERLQTQWGGAASLTLVATDPGTLATLRLPFQPQGAS